MVEAIDGYKSVSDYSEYEVIWVFGLPLERGKFMAYKGHREPQVAGLITLNWNCYQLMIVLYYKARLVTRSHLKGGAVLQLKIWKHISTVASNTY